MGRCLMGIMIIEFMSVPLMYMSHLSLPYVKGLYLFRERCFRPVQEDVTKCLLVKSVHDSHQAEAFVTQASLKQDRLVSTLQRQA